MNPIPQEIFELGELFEEFQLKSILEDGNTRENSTEST